MSDHLEDFIRNNRSEFDIDEPSIQLWKGIEHQIPGRKPFRLWTSISVAASVLVLIVAAYFIGLSNAEPSLDKNLFASEDEFEEFKEASEYYMTTIDYKMDQAKAMGVEDDVLEDLKQLDEVYNELREEMIISQTGDREVLINLMINNYKTKIDILERIIDKKNNNESKIKTDETISI